jgi:hypothetical protein
VDLSAVVGPALATLGPWGLLILTVAAVLTAFIRGMLVPGSRLDKAEDRHLKDLETRRADHEAEKTRMVTMWEARLNESRTREQDWRAAFERSEERGDVLALQVDKLMAYAQTTDALLRAIPRGDVR